MAERNPPASWYVYIVRCADASLYTGVTRDLQRRVAEHNGDDGKGAKYTRTRRPVTLYYQQACANKHHAYRAEYRIKRLSKRNKLRLVEKDPIIQQRIFNSAAE